MRLLTCLITLALAISARASSVTPADSNAGQIPNITVWDESNTQKTLWSELNAGGAGPVFVLPVFTHCTMSCPVLASRLVHETAQLAPGKPFRVLIFSFDPGEDAASLRKFRAQEKLPAAWMLVRSTDPEIRRFIDFFHYKVLTQGELMLHTNQIFILNHTLTWRATLINESWSAAELRTWLGRVEVPGVIGWLVMNPERLAFIGLGGMVLSLALILWAMLSRPGRPLRTPPPDA